MRQLRTKIFQINSQFRSIYYTRFNRQSNQQNNQSISSSLQYVQKRLEQHSKHPMSQKIKVKKLQNTPYVIAPEQIIGKASFSIVVKAYNVQSPKQQLVAKIISVKNAQTSVTIKTELQMLKKLPHHLNLVNCMKCQISSENNFYMIMEFCNEGNLDKYMVRKKFNIPEQKIWFFLKQFTEGYKVLYNNGIIHRDIKPENILIHNGDFKIADFGLSKDVEDMEINANMSVKGTPLYMAPQIHQQKEGSSKIDVFSLGVVLYRMAFNGQYPFFDQGRKYRSINEYFKELLIRKLTIPSTPKRSPVLINLIEKMLIKDKQKRISWKEIFQMDQIKNAIRFERKKQIIPLQQLSRSLMIVNRSQTQVRIVQSPQTQNEGQTQNSESTNIILEQTFNKTNKSNFEKILFKNKLLYTLIEYTNKKMQRFTKKTLALYDEEQATSNLSGQDNQKKPPQDSSYKKYEKLYRHICKNLTKIIEQGILFSLFVISKLEQISGDWSQLNQGEIMNFQDIFENDKGIFIQQYKELKELRENNLKNNSKLTPQQKGKELSSQEKKPKIGQNPSVVSKSASSSPEPNYVFGSYQDVLYNILNEYFQYPVQVRSQLRAIFALLVNIYDLAIKSEATAIQVRHHKISEQKHQARQKDRNLVQKAQDQTTIQFYQYLMDIETVEQTALKEQMHKKGLIFM